MLRFSSCKVKGLDALRGGGGRGGAGAHAHESLAADLRRVMGDLDGLEADLAALRDKAGLARFDRSNRNQKHPTVSAPTQANTRNLAKGHVDHPPHCSRFFFDLPFPAMGENLCGHQGEHTPLPDEFSSFLLNSLPDFLRALVGATGFRKAAASVERSMSMTSGPRAPCRRLRQASS